jgi:hypothetical protein
LTSAVMRPDTVGRGHREPALLCAPDAFFGKAMHPACETALALPLRHVVTFDQTGGDRIAHRCMRSCVSTGFRFSEDHGSFDLSHPARRSHFDHLSVQQSGRRDQPRLRLSPAPPVAGRLNPAPRGLQQCIIVCGSVIPGKAREGSVGHLLHPIHKPSGVLLRAFPHHAGQPYAPHWCQSSPDPGIARGLTGEWGAWQGRFLRVHHPPQGVQRPCRTMQGTPKVPRDGTAMQSGAMPPLASRVLVHGPETTRGPAGLACRQSAHRRLTKSRGAFHTRGGDRITPGHTASTPSTQSLQLAMTCAIFDHVAGVKREAVISAACVRTLQRVPVHCRLLDWPNECLQGYVKNS